MSNIGIEFESRIMLTEEEYLNIVSFYHNQYPDINFLKNTNIYFDSNDLFLKNRHITLRVRIIDDTKYELTLKIKGHNGDQEINDDLNVKEMEALTKHNVFPTGHVKNYLLSLSYPLSNYHPVTTLYNERLEIPFIDHLLVIDKNKYGHIIDYNLEIESQNSIKVADKLLNDYIKKFQLTLLKQKYIGKAHRAIDEATKK